MTADASKLVERLHMAASILTDIGGQSAMAATVREAADALEAAREDVEKWRSPNPYLHSCCREAVDEVCQDIEAAICGATGANDEG